LDKGRSSCVCKPCSEFDNAYESIALRELEVDLDVIVTPTDDGRTWSLTDLLGRPMGQIKEASAKQFTIHPEGHALETMAGLEHEPFASLDAALAAIEKHTRGVCRRNPGEDQP
jgi:hypothetical protein